MLEVMKNAAEIVSAFITVGLFFDLVYLTPEQKLEIQKLITRGAHDEKTFTDTLLDYLRAINRGIFDHHFSGSFWSVSYFTKCAVLSLFSLAIIFLAQIWFAGYGQSGFFFDSRYQISVVAICVCINVIVDWLSIGQTQVFFSIAADQDRLWRVALIVVSDLFVTLNLFIGTFAVAVTALLFMPGHKVKADLNANVYVTDLNEMLTKNNRNLAAEISDLPHPKATLFIVNVPSNSDYPNIFPATSMFDVVTKDASIDLAHVIGFIFQGSRLTQSNARSVVITNAGSRNEVAVQRGGPEWNKLKAAGAQDRDTLTVEASSPPQWDFSFTNLNNAYTAAFHLVAQVQLGFPGILFAAPQGFSLGQVELLHRALMPPEQFVFCKQQNVWQEQEIGIKRSAPCDEKVIFLSAQRSVIESELDGLAKSKVIVPLNTFFATSFCVTGLLYGLLLFLSVARMLWKVTARFLSSYQRVFLRSPLGWAGCVIGLVLFLITNWA